jgi:two-component system response regulator
MYMSAKKILVVDDDEEDRFIIQDGFTEVGAEDIVHFEENGEKALQYLEDSYNQKDLPSLIILDLNMPRLNGTQTLRAIKSDDRFNNIRVLIYSTSLNKIEKEQCMLLGAEEYIIKPLTFAESLEKANYFKNVSQTLTS